MGEILPAECVTRIVPADTIYLTGPRAQDLYIACAEIEPASLLAAGVNDTVGVYDNPGYTNFTDVVDTPSADASFIWSSKLVRNQTFDAERFADDTLDVPEFDICAEVAAVIVGTSIGLAACDGIDSNQTKVLSLESCAEDQTAFSRMDRSNSRRMMDGIRLIDKGI